MIPPGRRCDLCEGTGYDPLCTERDRERGDLWACLRCFGTGFCEFEDDECDRCGHLRHMHGTESGCCSDMLPGCTDCRCEGFEEPTTETEEPAR